MYLFKNIQRLFVNIQCRSINLKKNARKITNPDNIAMCYKRTCFFLDTDAVQHRCTTTASIFKKNKLISITTLLTKINVLCSTPLEAPRK